LGGGNVEIEFALLLLMREGMYHSVLMNGAWNHFEIQWNCNKDFCVLVLVISSTSEHDVFLLYLSSNTVLCTQKFYFIFSLNSRQLHITYYIKDQQDATLAVLFISHCKITVHVSDAFCVHHQEY